MCVSNKYPELFHYTTVDAFRSIYKSDMFWATHYADLNDRSELSRFWLKVRDSAAPYIHQIFEERRQCGNHFAAEVDGNGGTETVAFQEAEMHANLLHQKTFREGILPNVFICSFCFHESDSYKANHGLLSQWRGYGVDGGIAIVLKTLGIEKSMNHEKIKFLHLINHIGDVIYDDDPDLKERKEVRKVFDLLPNILRDYYSYNQPSYEQIFEPFVIGSTLVKHCGFREESEIRIVVAPRCKSKPIKYRRSGDSEVRYIELFGNAPLPIKRVIVGPSRIQNLNYQSIKECVAESEIEIQMSEIPFVG